MENKKSNVGWIITTIVLLLIIGGISFIVLKDKGIIKIGKNSNKTETKVEEKNKKESKKEESEELTVIKEKKLSNTSESLGKLKVENKEYDVNYDCTNDDGEHGCTITIGDKKIENRYLKFATVMDKFIVVRVYTPASLSENLYILDSNTEDVIEPKYYLVDKFVIANTDGTITDSTDITASQKYSNSILDSNRLIISECTEPRNKSNHNQDYVEELITLKDGKVSVEELTVVENIFCSTQR